MPSAWLLSAVVALAACSAGPPRPDPAVAASPIPADSVAVRFTGVAAYSPVDADGDGRYDGLDVEVEVEVVRPGRYAFGPVLSHGDTVVSTREGWYRSALLSASVDAPAPGLYAVGFRFSGEEIARSGLDGPYTVRLASTTLGASASATFRTPAYDHRDFGEAVR